MVSDHSHHQAMPERAERARHERARLEFAAAAAARLPGEFRAFTVGGLRALLTTSPGLDFLNSVTGLAVRTVADLPGVLDTYAAAGSQVPSLVVDGPGERTGALAGRLRRLGFHPADPRLAGIIDLDPGRPAHMPALHVTEAVTDAESEMFLNVLAAGYGADHDLTKFIRAGHAAPGLRRFLAWRNDQAVAAAAYSLHGDIAVFGGASTRPEARGSGAQTALLRHRLRHAAAVGAVAATATAAPGSPSARNLSRAGFTVWQRQSWSPSAGTADPSDA